MRWCGGRDCSDCPRRGSAKPARPHHGCTSAANLRAPRPLAGLLVADLTSMWAGPLCGQLLARAGAVVVKVESPARPDGTRGGDPRFFDWMNGGKLCYSVDFDRDRARLAALLAAADVVLEGSRPAALVRRGLGPAGHVPPAPDGCGCGSPATAPMPGSAERVAFGDDAAVAGGLVGYDGAGPAFVGDAIADPLTGLEAAAAVRASVGRGGGELIEVAMAAVAASYAAQPANRTNRTSSPNRCRRPCVRQPPRWAPTPRRSNGWSPTGRSPKSPAPHADHPGEPAGRCGRRHPRRSDDHGGRRAADARTG